MLHAVNDRIIVLLDKKPDSPLFLPEDLTIRNQGVVQDIGPNVSEVAVGDHIIFHRFDELELPQDNLVVVRESSVLGRYEK